MKRLSTSAPAMSFPAKWNFVFPVKQICRDVIRRCCLLGLILFCVCFTVSGKIRNGYDKDIAALKESLAHLQNVLLENRDLPAVKRRKIESTIETLVNHISHYELTENLLTQFKIIAPQLYAQIDTITDRLGRPVNVHIKFVPVDATAVKAWGTTYISQLENDKDAYCSEYGPFTVSVKVWIVANALLVLSHELGHVKYQVPNLASYLEFHKNYYDNRTQTTFIGHNPNDPSGKNAHQFSNIFRKEYARFLKNTNERLENPSGLLARIRKNLNTRYYSVAKTERKAELM